MKLKIKSTFLTLAGLGFLANSAMAAISIESGGLAVAFYSTNAAETDTYVFDLGSGALFRENTSSGVPVTTVNNTVPSANIGTDLVNTFGANWYDSGEVRWMVVGTVKSTDPVTNGDPARTSYYSIARNNLSVNTTIASISPTYRGTLCTQLTNFTEGVALASQTVGANTDGSIIAESQLRTVDEYVPPSVGTYFGVSIDPQQALASGSITNSGGAFEGALDLYRILHTATGADLTAGFSSGNAVVGQGQYIGTLALDSTGNLSVIPEPSSTLLGIAGALGLCLRRRR